MPLAKYADQPAPISFTTERKTGSPLPSPFGFARHGESGLEISDIFPKLAGHADRLAVIRSMHAQVPNHEPSLMLMNCGDSVQPRPSVGSWILYGLGTENQNLPGFVAMCPGGHPVKGPDNWQSGFLPATLQGTSIDSQHTEIEKLIENIRSPHASAAVQRHQLDWLQKLNAAHREARGDARLDARIHSFEMAFRMQVEAAEAFDLTRESAADAGALRRHRPWPANAHRPPAPRAAACATCSSGTGPASRGTTTNRSSRTTAPSPARSINRWRRC